MESSRTQLQVSVLADPGSNPAELERFGLQLTQRIRELKVDSVAPAAGTAPEPHAKGDPITFASLAVTLLPVLLPKVIDVVRDLLKGRRDRKIQLQVGSATIVLPADATPEEVDRAVALLNAASKSGTDDEPKAGATHRE